MTRRILGLGKAAQVVLLAIYRLSMSGRHETVAPLSAQRFGAALAQLKYKALVRQTKGGARPELTTRGRSVVARVAPLYLVLVFLGIGCGPEFVAIDEPEEPCVIVLDPGEPEAPIEEVLVDIERAERRASDGGAK